FAVSLVVFSDGENDVKRPGNDPGLLGEEGLARVKELEAQVKVPTTTIGFVVSGNAKAETALREIAWPTRASYYDAGTNADRLTEVLAITHKRLSDRIQILFGPVREAREQLAGKSMLFHVRLRTVDTNVLSSGETPWSAPAVGVPVADSACMQAEVK